MKSIQSKYYLRHLLIALAGEILINGFLCFLVFGLGYDEGIGKIFYYILHFSLFMVAPAIFFILEHRSLKQEQKLLR